MVKPKNIPVTMDDGLVAEIDRVAAKKNESRSAVMREAIRRGLPAVEAGFGDDTLAGLLSRAAKVAEATRLPAVQVQRAALRAGLIRIEDALVIGPDEAKAAVLGTDAGLTEPESRGWLRTLFQQTQEDIRRAGRGEDPHPHVWSTPPASAPPAKPKSTRPRKK